MNVPLTAPITAQDAVSRARTWLGRGKYKLGGGALYLDGSPFGDRGNQFPGTCDCSGFVAWCLRYRRGPWNTDAMVHDAKVGGDRFHLVGRNETVRASDVLVYPGPDVDHDGERDAPGHCGVIVEVLPSFVRGKPEWWEALRVAHCSPRREAQLGAVRVTDATLWAARGFIVRARHVE